MLGPILACGFALMPQRNVVELQRGLALPGHAIKYFGVEDTTLDPAMPDSSFGGVAFLKGGSNRAILIRFADLQRSLGTGRRIAKATLVLMPSGPTQAQLAGASTVLAEWHEGPAFVVNFGNLSADPGHADSGAATFRDRVADKVSTAWKGAGCSGLNESKPLPGARLSIRDDGAFLISGIEPAIQSTYDSCGESGGLLLRFSGNCEFFSSQSPQFGPMLRLETEEVKLQGTDLAVRFGSKSAIPAPPKAANDPSYPASGTEVRLTAFVRNLSSSPISGYRARWRLGSEWGAWIESGETLQPGEEKEVASTVTFADARIASPMVSFRAEPLQPDSVLANNQVDFPLAGLGIAIRFSAQEQAARNWRGTSDRLDACQAALDFLNRYVAPQSRYSFAPNGALERFYLSHSAEAADAEVEFDSNPYVLAERIVQAIRQVPLGFEGAEVSAANAFGGFGGGETRFDGAIPRSFFLPREPVSNPLLNVAVAGPTGLMPMTDVFALNHDLGKRGVHRGTWKDSMPGLTLFKAMDFGGNLLAKAEIDLVPLDEHGRARSAPIARVVTGSNGEFVFPRLPEFASSPAHPMGPAENGKRGSALMFRLVSGEPSSTFLSAWQVIDQFARSGASPAVMELRFNACDVPLDNTNLCTNRIVSDASGLSSALLSKLVDGTDSQPVELPNRTGDWVEIDLGRDRALGAVQLTYDRSAFWKAWEIAVYNTGQTPSEAVLWRAERDSDWAYDEFGQISDSDKRMVTFRGKLARVRYLRIRCVTPGGRALLREIRAYGGRAS